MRDRSANVAFLCCDKALAAPLVGLASSLASNEPTNPPPVKSMTLIGSPSPEFRLLNLRFRNMLERANCARYAAFRTDNLRRRRRCSKPVDPTAHCNGSCDAVTCWRMEKHRLTLQLLTTQSSVHCFERSAERQCKLP